MSAIAGGRCRRSRAARRVPVADAGRGAAVRQGDCDRILAVRGSDAGGPAPGGRARAAGAGRGRAGPSPVDPGLQPRRSRTRVAAPPAAEQDNAPPRPPSRAPSSRLPPKRPPRSRHRRSACAVTSAGRIGPEPAGAPVPAAPGHPKSRPAPIPAVIPIIRAPDDPGVDDEGAPDEFAEQIGPPKAQAGGWRGFLSRWGG